MREGGLKSAVGTPLEESFLTTGRMNRFVRGGEATTPTGLKAGRTRQSGLTASQEPFILYELRGLPITFSFDALLVIFTILF